MKIWVLIQIMIASFIFFPTKEYAALPEDYGLKAEEVRLVTEDGVQLAGWYLFAGQAGDSPKKGQSPTIYLLHGNAGNIGDRLFKAAEWVKRGFSIFLLDYRGYGKSSGQITSEQDLYRDAQAGLEWLKARKKIGPSETVLYGESIGAAVVLELAAKEKFRAIILEAPFTSLSELAKVHYPFVPGVFTSGFQFQNMEKISKVHSPLLILHGEEDEICPFEMGRALYERAQNPKELFRIPNGHHNDLPDVAGPEFYDRAVQSLMKHQ